MKGFRCLNFSKWKREKINQLNKESSVIQTQAGPIEYCLKGKETDPVVAIMHGAPGGFDQGLMEQEILLKNGFRILTWSRPGYLRTPLSVGKNFKEQASAFNTLLEALKIPKVSVMGISAGGVPALFFAQDYPQKNLFINYGGRAEQRIYTVTFSTHSHKTFF